MSRVTSCITNGFSPSFTGAFLAILGYGMCQLESPKGFAFHATCILVGVVGLTLEGAHYLDGQ